MYCALNFVCDFSVDMRALYCKVWSICSLIGQPNTCRSSEP